jgi:prepilin-type N-terminal cleavage/methylation domain-containing protein
LASWWGHLRQPNKLYRGWFGKREKGLTLIETTVALAVLGIMAVAFLGGLGTSFKAASVNNRQATAETLVVGEIEYIKSGNYTSEYSVDPVLDIPAGWSVPTPTVELINTGIQKVNVKAVHNGEEILSIYTYKVNR